MDLAEAIRTRRSVGAFTDQAVDPALVQELIDTAVWVPNHKMTEPWRFVFLSGEGVKRYASIRRDMALEGVPAQDEETRRQAGEGTYQKFAIIPSYLGVIMKQHENPEIREEDYAACCCLTQNFLLLAWERGLGTSWKTFKRDARLRVLLDLADDEIVVGWLHLGYPVSVPVPTPRAAVHERFTLLSR
jgi:nitroreductase